MDDLISRETAIAEVEQWAEHGHYVINWTGIKAMLEIQPAVDAVQVVRCAECKYCFDADRYTPYDGEEEWFCAKWKRYVSVYVLDPYRHYCAAGEKREIRVKDVVCGGDGYGE